MKAYLYSNDIKYWHTKELLSFELNGYTLEFTYILKSQNIMCLYCDK